jgi:hypothetical protein
MRKYALLLNNKIVEIREIDDAEIAHAMQNSQCVIDIEDMIPQPSLGWVLNGNTLQIPTQSSSLEDFEIDLNNRKSIFGTEIVRECINKIGARNKILNKTGTQVGAVLTQMLSVKLLLETGALGTARSACSQLVYVFPEYQDILNYVISQINNFEIENGL